jgi:hypothetical protein
MVTGPTFRTCDLVILPASDLCIAMKPRPAARPPARPPTPRDIIADRAVLSLPQLIIWDAGRSLSWTHHGQLVTWPAGDTDTASGHSAS